MRSLKMSWFLLAVFVVMSAMPRLAAAHCQIPCGIYDDNARVAAMLEDVETIKKSITMINELADKTDVQSRQQFVRWVMNKENHAQKLIATTADYFLTQRIKPAQEDYVERLKKHHAVILNAMKAKQGADMKTAAELEESVKALLEYYPEHKH
ncbi:MULTISPECIES: superoxide dismutase, Ni [unclassified Pseudodesulfovibrio]|uniref:superoxide dismutase, Ni n=1 Tax=unclassified Pseudodesulfovibrio TaxID=2661612 RepID=UPI000FEBA849|nr:MULTISPECIES: superoxide dismutase, Ni [unclassified Pseudodesulfovibrio]MCJ2164608.1 superoxide dismutase, Ni [Pseudodesulfovibrio sp. S3-i]RWU04198.1 superoxide dismutase [Pseudodesulfovibrio sp. S3]